MDYLSDTDSETQIEVATTSMPNGTFIFFHGMNDKARAWAQALSAIKGSHVKLVCPTAKKAPVTAWGGYRATCWFDLVSWDEDAPEDVQGIKRAARFVHDLIDEQAQITGISSARTVIGGFSQGGALAFYAALTYTKLLAGVIGLSAWLPLHKQFSHYAKPFNKKTPFLLCHGDADPVMPYLRVRRHGVIWGRFLENYDFKLYRGMMHTASEEEMEAVRLFLDVNLPRKKAK